MYTIHKHYWLMPVPLNHYTDSTGPINGTITDLQLSEQCIWSASTDSNIRLEF